LIRIYLDFPQFIYTDAKNSSFQTLTNSKFIYQCAMPSVRTASVHEPQETNIKNAVLFEKLPAVTVIKIFREFYELQTPEEKKNLLS